MIHRSFLFVAVMVVLGSCRSMEPAGARPAANPVETTEELAERLHPPLAHDAGSTSQPMKPIPNETYNMIHKLSDFSFNLFRKLSSEKPGEAFSFSPASLNMALALVYSGARGDTREQMSRLTGFYMEEDMFHKSYFAWFSEMQNLFADTLLEFNLANRVFLEQSYDVLESFQSNIETWHGGAFEKTDFMHRAPEAEQRINAWVEEITRNRIKDLIPRGTLNEFTRLVLTNALYVKSTWRFPFDENDTREKFFNSVGGEQVPVDYMIQRERGISWLELDDRLVIQLPYTSPNLSLVLIRPHGTGVTDLAAYVPDAESFKNMLVSMRPEDVHMEIPRFKIESSLELGDALKQMGMDDAFDQRADFSGISTLSDLSVSAVLQKVFFEIDEEGTEAAAATAIIVVTTSMPMDDGQDPKYFIADRPFLFILKENYFDTPLFIGQFSR